MKPILFSTPMVQAILKGRKTMTRRVMKPQPVGEIKNRDYYEFYGTKTARIFTDTQGLCAKYALDDILWVRETWYQHYDGSFAYRASSELETKGWRPSIFMPREACRIFLRVTDVRAERLQDITPEDVQREGLEAELPSEEAKARYPEGSDEMIGVHNWCKEYSQFIFRNLWNSINSKRGFGWDANPWVWVISFERCEKPEATSC